ncbi:MAG: YncE family protein [Solirubrobacterales bacterium]
MGNGTNLSRRGRAAMVVVAAGTCAAFAGCGGGAELKPAAEPAVSPPASVEPVGKVVNIGPGAEGMAFDTGTDSLAIGLREPYRLALVDPQKLFITAQFPVPNPVRHLAVSPRGSIVAVPSEFADSVYEVSAKTGDVAKVAAGEHPHDVTFADGKIFAADEFSDSVTVIRGSSEVATLPAPAQPGGIAAVGNKYIALVTVAERVLQVYDARSYEELGQISAGVGPTHIETLGSDAFVVDTEGDVIRRFSIGSEPREVETVPAPGTPYGIAIDTKRKQLWVTLTATNRLARYSLSGPRMRRFGTYPTISQANSVTVDPASGDVFVSSRTTGQLQRISPKHVPE